LVPLPLVVPLLSLEPGEVPLEPMLPLGIEGLAAAFGLVAELFEPLTGPEGDVIPPLLSVLGLAALFGLAAAPLLGPMVLLELPAAPELVVPPVSWAKTAGAKAATDNANPALRK
jgi:hypothetical protein